MLNKPAQNNRYGKDDKYKALRDDYKTPAHIYEPILRYFKRDMFDIDACCTDKNIPARQHFTKAENGLLQPWSGFVFCNPPWNQSPKFVKKAVAELSLNRNLIVTFVLSADKMYVGYVQDLILNNPDAVWFVLRGKQGFVIPGEEEKPPVPSVGVMVAILSKHAGEIQYGMNFYNLFDTFVYKGEKLKTEYKQQMLFGGGNENT